MAEESKILPSRFHRQIPPLEHHHHRPMLLKDFLRDDASSKSTALSSSKSNSSHIVLFRSWSKRAAATRISAVHKVIKLLHLASSKSPSVLPRSISRRLTKRGKEENDVVFGRPSSSSSEVKVKVKDILRWRSFRDLADDDPTPLHFPPSPYRSTATTTTTATSCSKRSSWCDSDFTAEELPAWGGESQDFWGKNAAATLKNPKGDWSSSFEEYEQQSPVSVLDSPFQEFTTFHIQRAKCDSTRRTQERSTPKPEITISKVNTAEEKAKQLLRQVKEEEELYTDDEQAIFDFFVDELSIYGKFDDDEFDCKLLRIAESWMDGEFEESYEWEVEEERESFVKDMEKGICWRKFEEEQQELCEELEVRVLDSLMDDLVLDFIARRN